MPILLRPWSWPPSSPSNQVPETQTYCNKLLEAGLVIMNTKQEHNTRCWKTSSVVSETQKRVEILPPLGVGNSGVAWEKGQWQWLIMVLWNNWAVEYECDRIKYKVWYRIHQVPLVSNLDVLKIIPSALMWSESLWFFTFLSRTMYEQVITTQSNTWKHSKWEIWFTAKKGGNMG